MKPVSVAFVYNVKNIHPGDVGYEEEAEFDSPETIEAVAKAIQKVTGGRRPHMVEAKDGDKGLLSLFDLRPDVVFNMAECKRGRARESIVPGICDFLGIEHTGSDAMALAISLDKDAAKAVVERFGVVTPRGVAVRGEGWKEKLRAAKLSPPYIVKPNAEGSSKGIYEKSVVHSESDLYIEVEKLIQRNIEPLVEEYVTGTELTIGLLASRTGEIEILRAVEVRFDDRLGKTPVYSLGIKAADQGYEYHGGKDNVWLRYPNCTIVAPAAIDKETLKKVEESALRAFEALSLRDYARIDFRLRDEREPVFIEANPLPGLTPLYSDLVVAAAASGISHEELVARILLPAMERVRRKRGALAPGDGV